MLHYNMPQYAMTCNDRYQLFHIKFSYNIISYSILQQHLSYLKQFFALD